jgi:hypothetical protein
MMHGFMNIMVQQHLFLSLTLDGGDWQFHALAASPLQKELLLSIERCVSF